MNLYDQDFIDSLGSFDKYANPWVLAICKNNSPSAIYQKANIEKWFDNLPEEVKADFRGRLRSKRDGDFLSAYYELVFHQYCLEVGWNVTKDKVFNNKTPDLFIETDDNKFVIEVLVLQKSDIDKKNNERFNDLLRKIETIDTRYLLSVDLEEWLNEDSDIDKIVRLIATQITSLGKINNKEELELNESGFHGKITVYLNKDYKPRGKILSWSPPGGFFAFPTDRIKNEMRKKIAKYNFFKEMGIPFVVAICSDEAPFISHSALDWTLYGRMVVTWNINEPDAEAKSGRDNSGFITPNPGLMWETQNTGLSAVIFCSRHWGQEKVLYDMRVYHNAWARNKLDSKYFEQIPQFVEVNNDPNFVTLEWINNNKQLVNFN